MTNHKFKSYILRSPRLIDMHANEINEVSRGKQFYYVPRSTLVPSLSSTGYKTVTSKTISPLLYETPSYKNNLNLFLQRKQEPLLHELNTNKNPTNIIELPQYIGQHNTINGDVLLRKSRNNKPTNLGHGNYKNAKNCKEIKLMAQRNPTEKLKLLSLACILGNSISQTTTTVQDFAWKCPPACQCPEISTIEQWPSKTRKAVFVPKFLPQNIPVSFPYNADALFLNCSNLVRESALTQIPKDLHSTTVYALFNNNNITSLTASDFNKHSKLLYLNLAYNNISYISNLAFAKQKYLRILETDSKKFEMTLFNRK